MAGSARRPTGFILAAKVPQSITHEKVLQDCDEDLKHFLETMDLMGDKLGPLLFQFGYFNKKAFKSGEGISSASRTIPEKTSRRAIVSRWRSATNNG